MTFEETGEFHAWLVSNANLQPNKTSKEVIPTISQYFVHSMKWKKGFQSENFKEVLVIITS